MVVSLQSQDADQLIATLSSDTTRTIYSELRDESATAINLASMIDASTQTVHYHLRKLREAGLIQIVGIEYSEKGVEMKSYEPTGNVVICDDLVLKNQIEDLLQNLNGDYMASNPDTKK